MYQEELEESKQAIERDRREAARALLEWEDKSQQASALEARLAAREKALREREDTFDAQVGYLSSDSIAGDAPLPKAIVFYGVSVSELQHGSRRRLCCWNSGPFALALVLRYCCLTSHLQRHEALLAPAIFRVSLDVLCRCQQRSGCREA